VINGPYQANIKHFSFQNFPKMRTQLQ